MNHVFFFLCCVTAGLADWSSLRTLDKRLDCRQPGLKKCEIENCSESHMMVPRKEAPTGPDWDSDHVGIWMDDDEPHSVVNVTWKPLLNGGIRKLRGSVIRIQDDTTNQSMCVQYSFGIYKVFNPREERWIFSLDGVVVEPGRTYTVSVFNLPEPEIGDYRIEKQIAIPGCSDRRIQKSLPCLQNGSLWDPHMRSNLSVDREHKKLSLVLGFEAAQYSEMYKVSVIQSHSLLRSENISKENRTYLNVPFEFDLWELSQCDMLITIHPFFIRCKNDCLIWENTLNYCQYYPPRTLFIKTAVGLFVIGVFLAFLVWSASHEEPVIISSCADEEQPERFKVQERKRVLIIYSLDHPLYKNIVLKLCAFLVTKCGTEVVLDLLDSTRLGVMGRIQWLDWHRREIERSSDKILFLCSKGVQAKWRAMCGDRQVFLREDARSLVGDMLSPALSLMVPHFIRSASFEKYIVAYFDDVCSEEDVPSPFHITVRYKLMKQFEELFFRILDTEKHKPGSVNHIEGLSEGEYHHCPSGRDLQDAIEAFQVYQLEHPQWFEEELLESSELEVEESSAQICQEAKITTTFNTGCEPGSAGCISPVETQESGFTINVLNLSEECHMHITAEYKPLLI
ncbi:interleukin-17 receptor A [Labrus bergylta]|uniref:interleukin-17 receptor A n=1 Tax=Labrus bergylta TaxID=56723 RepID=UPI003314477B